MSSGNDSNWLEVFTDILSCIRWTQEQKHELVKQSFELVMNLSMFARHEGISANQTL